MKITAKWIASPEGDYAGARLFTKCFAPKKEIKKATLYASAMGIYAPFVNGTRVGKGVLAPGWTSYKYRVQYQGYDVTALLTASENRIEIGVGRGWAVGFIGHKDTDHAFFTQPAVIAWLEVVYADGSRDALETDGTWEVFTSEVTFAEIYHGETVDKTAEKTLIGKAALIEVKTKLIPLVGEEITEQERLAPVELIHTPKGETVLDFGQNMTGYVQVSLKAPRGSRIVLHHAEVLDKDGNFYNENYRAARNEMTYVCSGDEDVFKPTYSFQGFRYVRVEEYPFDTVDPAAFVAIAVNSDMKRTGRFSCGNEKINQLYHNIVWGQKSNYLDVPTDCPQRDERLGWTGDAQVFCRTGAINFDVEKFFIKWLGDVAAEQGKDGSVMGIVPDAMPGYKTRLSAAWGDVACVAPWQMYLAYGNKKALKQSFPMMKKWVGYQRSAGPEEYLWLGGYHYGDWLAMDAGEDSYVGATSCDLIGSAYFAYSTKLVVLAGEALGEDVSEYRELYANIRKAFRAYFLENGMPKAQYPVTEIIPEGRKKPIDQLRRGMTQTAIVLILHFGLCEENERAALAAKLVELIRENGNRMTTGFVGTPYILHALSENGYTDVAYELLMQEKNPSWLYSVTHGATTMWEHWNSLKEDGSFWSTAMNSFNHYAYGAVYDWIFGVAAGIKPIGEVPAYREITVEPHPNKCLGFVDTSIDSRNGTVRMHWYYKGDAVYYELEIPEGVTAHLTLPSGYTATLCGGSYRFAE
ncbi:MAG: alfa-L-rhamnosidase [Ruminococcaceae bacterium]|nr:alfa-L-rhamnosidase [Oscillospiraceae bacterium]